MIKGDYDFLDRIAKNNVCAEHKMTLTVAWHALESCYALRCGEGEYPDAVTRQLSLTEELKAGADIPEPIKSNIIKGQRRRQMQQGKQVIPFTIGEVPGADLGTGELLLPEQVKALKDYALKYHLDPYRGHVVLMYGKPYITLDGYLFHAYQERIPYSLRGKPLTEEELKLRGYAAEDLGFISYAKLLETNQEFEGVGFVTEDEIEAIVEGKPTQKRYPVIANKPGNMVQKRAEWQALRRAFPIGESGEAPPP